MEATELLEIIARGEDSRYQFKQNFTNVDSLAAELVAFANSGGGTLLIGVDDNGEITGLSLADIGRLNQLLSNAASQSARPPINPLTQNIDTANGLVMVVNVPDGLNKPYVDNQGRIWVKSGSDKRYVTAREEMQRLFQQAGLVYADKVPVEESTVGDIDIDIFSRYFEQRYGRTLEDTGLPLPRLLENLNLARDDRLNLAGVILFAKRPQRFRPVFLIKAAAFPGKGFHETQYLDSEDIDGRLDVQYERGFSFLVRNLHHIQGDQGVNTRGVLEIPEIVLEELLVNSLMHRDYFVSAPIRMFIFSDRIEIISPGHLPNNLTPEHIRYGISNIRNPVLVSHAVHLMPYRGLGSGIPRALDAYPYIDLIDDRAANQFKAVVYRPASAGFAMA